MAIKLTSPVNPALEPFAVFGIIWGVVSMIGLPLFQVFVPLSHETRRVVLLGAVLLAAIAGSTYSITYARRASTSLSLVDSGIYYFFWPLLFLCIFGFGVYLS